LLVIDISVPRNVDPLLGRVPGYTVLDIDALQEIDQKEKEAQIRGVDTALQLCREATEAVIEWERRHRLMQPAIDSLAEAFESVRRHEVERFLNRFHEKDREQVEFLTRSIMQKLLTIPVVRLKATEGDESVLEQQVAALAALFARERCEESEPARRLASAEALLSESNRAT
jgi:glutamyl-tRNA reductase